MKHYKIYLTLFISTLLFSCREENPAVFNPQDQLFFSSWDEIFESYWNGMNYSYAFWDIDPTDWDAVYREYKPRFKDLEFKNSEDSATVKELFEGMTENLIDHPYLLTLYKENGEEWFQIRPAINNDIKKRDYFHLPFSEESLRKTIEANEEKGRIKQWCSAQVNDLQLHSYCIDKNIVYFRLNTFALYDNIAHPEVEKTWDNYLSLIETTPDLKGIVIDTRCNGGGSIVDLSFILSPLITQETTFGYTRSKNGMGRLDYTPWSPFILYPASKADGELEYLKEIQIERNLENIPIVALADLHSVSMGEITPMAICSLPNGCFIGETTWGGHGPLTGNFNGTYGGAFANKAFEVYTSTSHTKNIDGTIYEGIGLTPDIEALYNEEAFMQGNDTQLERAIQYIQTGK